MNIQKYHKISYSSPRGYGAWTPRRLEKQLKSVIQNNKNAPRPYPYFSIVERLKQAWDVLTYRADALYWNEPF